MESEEHSNFLDAFKERERKLESEEKRVLSLERFESFEKIKTTPISPLHPSHTPTNSFEKYTLHHRLIFRCSSHTFFFSLTREQVSLSTHRHKLVTRADTVATFVASTRFPLITLRFQDDPSSLSPDLLPNFLSRLEFFLNDNGGVGVAGGTMFTYADFLLVDLLKHAEDENISMSLDLYPRVAKIYDAASKHERLASYLESSRRRLVPDGSKVKEICSILDIPLPKYLLTSNE